MGESVNALNRRDYIANNWQYKMCYWDEFNYSILENCIYKKYNSFNTDTCNDITIMLDTETSKKHADRYEEIKHNVNGGSRIGLHFM